MTANLIHICHSTFGSAAWPLMAGGALGCAIHCGGICALCLSGGTALGAAFVNACRLAVRHVLPALVSVGFAFLSSHAGDFV